MKNLNLLLVAATFTSLIACSQPEDYVEEYAAEGTTEEELNQPVPVDPLPEDEDGTGEDEGQEEDPIVVEPPVPPPNDQAYFMPRWESSFGVTQAMYERVQRYYDQNWKSFSNRRYVVIIDMGLKSNKKRFVVFDLEKQTFEKYLTSHGVGSDPNNDGFLDSFSNTPNSKQTSIGYYKTAEVYNGSNGRSMRLDGLSETNSKARARAIVVHGANYVREKDSYAGRSWGCPALDHAVAQGVINQIKGGALMVVGTSRAI